MAVRAWASWGHAGRRARQDRAQLHYSLKLRSCSLVQLTHDVLIHQLPLDAAFATVRSVPTGLSQADAAARRLEFGPNRIERVAPTPLAVRFLRPFPPFLPDLL